MRVALFFDGKNFYSGWKDRTGARPIDFVKLADWLVEQAGGSVLWGAYYYTGIETGPEAASEGQRKLAAFLNDRELDRGFFVKRLPRRSQIAHCPSCGAAHRYTQEKEGDTTMVADMLTLAAVSAFEIAVLVSGDADHAPAVEGVRTLGKKIYVATWGGYGLSPRIRKAAFHHIDMVSGLPKFQTALLASRRLATPIGGTQAAPMAAASDGPCPAKSSLPAVLLDSTCQPAAQAEAAAPPASVATLTGEQKPNAVAEEATLPESVGAFADGVLPSPRAAPSRATSDSTQAVFLDELARAEARFRGGYVGLNYFLTKWISPRLDSSTDLRRRILDALKAAGKVGVYSAPDRSLALRVKR